ncbi:molybdopterin-synthase adenylyltransferase MoeB [soil metagenome]
MALSPDEIERYARHIVLADVGGPGQQKLKAARVLVIGAGGLGAPVLLYLVAAGIGTLGVVDNDTVSVSNLQRQIIHTTPRAGMAKTESAGLALSALNPHVTVMPHAVRLTAANAIELISQYDIVADGSDNFETRYIVSDACYLAKKTLVSAAVGQFDGQLATFKPHLTQADGTPYPTYRCLHPEAPPPGLLPACEEAGIIGALTGIIGSMQAMEVMKEILGIGDSLAGKLLMYDALGPRLFISALPWDPTNPLNGGNQRLTRNSV